MQLYVLRKGNIVIFFLIELQLRNQLSYANDTLLEQCPTPLQGLAAFSFGQGPGSTPGGTNKALAWQMAQLLKVS